MAKIPGSDVEASGVIGGIGFRVNERGLKRGLTAIPAISVVPRNRRGLPRVNDSVEFMRMTEATMEDRWFSVDEIAAHLGIKRDTVYE